MGTDYEQSRGGRRSFYCSNFLWNELKEVCKDKCSISEFMKEGVKEKLKKNNLIIFFCIQTFYYIFCDLKYQERNISLQFDLLLGYITFSKIAKVQLSKDLKHYML